MRAGIFLDRDGTIIEDYHYVGHIERVQLKPGAAEAIRRFNEAHIPVAMVTNQSGVARGFYTEADFHAVQKYIDKELALHNAKINQFMYSPHHPDGNAPEYIKDSWFHKPSPGMVLHLAKEMGLHIRKSIIVGDRPEDVELARRLKMHCVYLGRKPIKDWFFDPDIAPFPSLAEAAGYIIERITGVSQDSFPMQSYINPHSYFEMYSMHVLATVQKIDADSIERARGILQKAYTDGSAVFAAGNGGAAAIASHFVTDHIKHMSMTKTFFTNIFSLVDERSLITATANDMGYYAIFSYQLERRANKDDVLVVFSVGGNSANIIRALQCAQEMGMKTIAILGGDGGHAKFRADAAIHIPTWNYGIAEDIMQMLSHSLAQYIRQTQMSDKAIQSARF